MIKIYYKPNCATCQTALSLVKHETEEELDLVEYLVATPDEKELRNIVKMLGITVEQLVRKKEPLYKEKYEGKEISDDEWLTILKENPILIERPIVVLGDKAIIGRPPETIIEFIKKESKQNI
jgi:arsenate reductase (glutaredoxin)